MLAFHFSFSATPFLFPLIISSFFQQNQSFNQTQQQQQITKMTSTNNNNNNNNKEEEMSCNNFEDYFPVMEEKLGGDGLITELCKGFELLKDGEKGVISFESLKKNAAFLGLQELSDDDLMAMLREGDCDGDGVLTQMEFCVLMFRLSPHLMDLAHDFVQYDDDHDHLLHFLYRF